LSNVFATTSIKNYLPKNSAKNVVKIKPFFLNLNNNAVGEILGYFYMD
jgi:hypothetical protein